MPALKKRNPLTDSERGLVAEAIEWLDRYVIAILRRRRTIPPRWTDDDIRSAAMVRLCLAAQRFDPRRAQWKTYACAQMRLGVLDEYRGKAERDGRRNQVGKSIPTGSWKVPDGGEAVPFLEAIEDPSPGLAARQEEAEQIRADLEEAVRTIPGQHRRTFRRWVRYRTAAQDARADGVTESAVCLRRKQAMKAARGAAEERAA